MEVTATLTRFHKIEERFKAKRTEIERQIREKLSDKMILLTKGMEEPSIDNLAESEEAMGLLDDIKFLSKSISKIRAAIGVKNSIIGISELLAELDQLRYFRTLVAKTRNSKKEYPYATKEEVTPVNSDDLKKVLAGLAVQVDPEPLKVRVKGLHTSFDADLEDMLKELDTRINEITDTISDLNKEKITLSIPDEYGYLVGLAGKSGKVSV